MAKTGWICLASAIAAALPACNGPAPGPPLPAVDLGPSLGATRSDPLLLTFAAPRARSSYLVDLGYTLSWDERGVPSFATQADGNFGVALEVDGELFISDDDLDTPVTIEHTASDSAVLSFAVDEDLSGEIWFSVDSSHVATIDVRLTSTAAYERRVSLFPWLRKCNGAFEQVKKSARGITARHRTQIDPTLDATSPGTFVDSFADALAGDEAPVHALGSAPCGASAYEDLGLLINGDAPPRDFSEVVALRFDRDLPPVSSMEMRFHRAIADAAQPKSLDADLDKARALDQRQVLLDGKSRLDAIPPLDGLGHDDALLYRSSFALLEEATMPSEGNMAREYYLPSREPKYWFGRLGQRMPESLAMILLAHRDPEGAVGTMRNFIMRIEQDGYLPLTVGPIADQTKGRVAATPLFSFEAWEIYQLAKDDAFLADAYAAGQLIHDFWVKERDLDKDGLCEWRSGVEADSGATDVIEAEVGPPELLESVDLNSMLVMEEKSLASMATALGRASEAASWTSAAEARAAMINATMWDAVTGFYYPVSRASNTFTFQAKDDLKRMEIAGLLPLWAGIVPDDRRAALVAKIADPSIFLRPNGLATLSARDHAYAPIASSCCRWNGPAVVPWTWLVWRGLRAYGEMDLARDIEQRTYAALRAGLAGEHVFRGLYGADDPGAPNDSETNHVWSTLGALMMIEGRQ